MNYYLCFDAGTQSVKVAVYDEKGNQVAVDVNPTTLYYPNQGWVEMNVHEYFELALKGMKKCSEIMREKNLSPSDVKAIMGDGIICGISGINENAEPVTPYINYLDSRTQSDADYLTSLNLDIWANETGNPEPLCLFPALFARWLLKNSPNAGKISKFVHNAPYILMKLAGLKANDTFIDWGTMSGWGLGYNVIKKEWSDEQLKILDIDKKFMPKIVKPYDIIGKLSKECAEITGFSEETAICAGAGDTMESLLACGVHEPGHAVDVAGTCSMFCISTSGILPGLSKKGNGLIFNSGTLPDTYFYWGFVRTGGLALRWFRDNICNRPGDDSYYKFLSDGAEKLENGSEGVRFLPWLTGGPEGFREVHGCFINMTMNTNQFVLWRSVLEAIAGEYSEIAEKSRKAGTPINRVIITEGGSKDPLWNQIKADMIQAETLTLKTGGALAVNALIAAYAVGELKDLTSKIHEGLTETGHYKPQRELKLPEIPFKLNEP
ncbi:MAG: carbohydrate kinase [Synergistaceae bacterium]|nr:carbohydrate kinase [Synergistaceae bacterium]MBR0315541.1 carbohydrate kinase [Synergistaceae bacterium]